MRVQKKITGVHKELVEFIVKIRNAWIVLRNYRTPSKSINVLKNLKKEISQLSGNHRRKKLVKVDGNYYWALYIPGWKSKAFVKFFEGELNRIDPLQKKTNRLLNVFVAITKKCPLKCEHCFEWDALNKKEVLTLPDINKIVQNFQDLGTSVIQFTGGEPMLRVNEMIEVMHNSRMDSDFWVLTSGFNFTLENAQRLKKARLTGVIISLDHFDPNKHNQFRGHEKSFDLVQAAVKHAIDSKLVTALSICVTRSFATEENLMKYANLAKKMGVAFIQLLEPKPVGHYHGKDVVLKKEHTDIIESFFLKVNYNSQYLDYPIISYHGYYQRRVGCFSFGNRNLYVDTDGDINACPFCQTKMGSALSENLETQVNQLENAGCQSFKNSSF